VCNLLTAISAKFITRTVFTVQ